MSSKKEKNAQCLSGSGCTGHLYPKHMDYKLKVSGKTVVVPDIEVLECDTCKERFFPYEASKKIDLYKEHSGRLMLRLNPEIHAKIIILSKRHHRSLNQEINHILEKTSG